MSFSDKNTHLAHLHTERSQELNRVQALDRIQALDQVQALSRVQAHADKRHLAINQMLFFCIDNTTCRHGALLQHFGEKLDDTGEDVKGCGACDNCLREDKVEVMDGRKMAEVLVDWFQRKEDDSSDEVTMPQAAEGFLKYLKEVRSFPFILVLISLHAYDLFSSSPTASRRRVITSPPNQRSDIFSSNSS